LTHILSSSFPYLYIGVFEKFQKKSFLASFLHFYKNNGFYHNFRGKQPISIKMAIIPSILLKNGFPRAYFKA